MAEEVITEDQTKKILANWAKNRKISLTSFSVSPLSNQLDGLIGEQFFLTINYKDEEESNSKQKIRFFVKTLSRYNPVMYAISREMMVFEKESFFYDEFVPNLKSYNLDCGYLAESYFGESFVIVLEDLSKASYTGSGKSGYLDLDHCYSCLKTIARFHADGILFQLLKSRDLSRNYDLRDEYPILKDTIYSQESRIMKYFYYSSVGIIEISNLLIENGTKTEEFPKKLEEAVENLKNIEETSRGFRQTVTHNDLWANNFLYKYDQNKKVESCKIIDFQTVSIKPPASDVLSFLFLNTRKKFRDEHLQELLQYYFNSFKKCIEERGFNPDEVLSEEEFKRSCKTFLIPAKIHSTVDRSITQIPEDIFVDAATSEEAFSNFVFEGRPKYMVEAFELNEAYKDIMTEDIRELQSLLSK